MTIDLEVALQNANEDNLDPKDIDREQLRGPLQVPVDLHNIEEEEQPPLQRVVAVNHFGDQQQNVLNEVITLPLIDGHSHIQGLSLGDASTDPLQRPKWMRRNLRNGTSTISFSHSALSFLEYSSTNDEVVAHMGLKQLNSFYDEFKTKLAPAVESKSDNVMITLGMDFGYTPLLMGRAIQTVSESNGARIRKRKENAKVYYASSRERVIEFVGRDGSTDLVDRTRQIIKTNSYRLKTHFLVTWTRENEECQWHGDLVSIVLHNNTVRFTVIRHEAPSAKREELEKTAITAIEVIRRRLTAQNTQFQMKFGELRFPSQCSFRPVPDVDDWGAYIDYFNWDPPLGKLADIWAVIQDCYYTAPSAEQRSEAYYFLNQKDGYYRNTIDAVWRVASFQAGRIWPLVPFDPRRANALKFAKEAIESKGFIGVKTYTRTIWRMAENERIYGASIGKVLNDRVDDLLSYLVASDTALLNHTSPTGWPAWPVFPEMYTSDKTDRLLPPNPLIRRDGQFILPQDNDDPYRISWQEVGTVWRNKDDAHGHPQFDQYRTRIEQRVLSRLSTVKPGDQALFETELARKCAVTAMRYAAQFAHYCYYIQLCVSPASWRSVLEKFPALRVDLAHAGSKLSPYTYYEIPRFTAAEKGLIGIDASGNQLRSVGVNAMVAPKTTHPAVVGRGGFHSIFQHAVERWCIAKYGDSVEHLARIVDVVLTSRAWRQWFDDWHTRFGNNGWWGDLMHLLQEYDNVYTDLAYYTENGDDMNTVLAHIIEGAINEQSEFHTQLRRKCFLGSDWFMVEGDGQSQKSYWALFDNAFAHHFQTHASEQAKQQHKTWHTHPSYRALWDDWTTNNVLRCFNITAARLEQMEQAYVRFRQKFNRESPNHLFFNVSEDLRARGDTWIKPLPRWWQMLKDR